MSTILTGFIFLAVSAFGQAALAQSAPTYQWQVGWTDMVECFEYSTNADGSQTQMNSGEPVDSSLCAETPQPVSYAWADTSGRRDCFEYFDYPDGSQVVLDSGTPVDDSCCEATHQKVRSTFFNGWRERD